MGARESAAEVVDRLADIEGREPHDVVAKWPGTSRNVLRVLMDRCYLRSPVMIRHAATIRAAPAHTATVGTSAKNTNPNSAAYGSAR
jgi:hypothetical protein